MIELAKERLRNLPEQLKGIPGQIRKRYDKINAPMGESEDVIGRRRVLRLLLLGGVSLAIAHWVSEQNRKAQESPWKFEKLGRDEIYLYSGTVTVKPEVTALFTSPPAKNQFAIDIDDLEVLETQYAPVVPPSPEDKRADPQKNSWVGVMTDKGLFFTYGDLVTIEGGSFIKAKKTSNPGEFIGPNGDIIKIKSEFK